MPVRISHLLDPALTPARVERDGGRRTGSGMPGYLLSFTADRKPVITYNSTRRCNLRCVHCYSNSANRRYEGELAAAEAEAMLRDMGAFGVPVVLFSGGEPLMRPGLYELVACARESGIRPALSTNGTLLTPRAAERLQAAGLEYAGISMDGFGATNDRFRGVPGAFGRMVEGIRSCRAAGIRVSLRFTITRHNVADLPRVFRFLEDEGIPRLCLYHLVYAGRGSDMRQDALASGIVRNIVGYVIGASEDFLRRGIAKDVLTLDQHADGVFLYLRLKRRDPARAREVYRLLLWQGGDRSGVGFGAVDPLGSIRPDPFSGDVSFGNVRERPFSATWGNRAISEVDDYHRRAALLKGRCASCRFLEICGGGFRARARLATGDPWASDPACYLTNDEIEVRRCPDGSYERLWTEPAERFPEERAPAGAAARAPSKTNEASGTRRA